MEGEINNKGASILLALTKKGMVRIRFTLKQNTTIAAHSGENCQSYRQQNKT